MKTQGIYVIVNIHTAQAYIGSSVDVASRWTSHKRELRQGCHKNGLLQEAWDQWGHTAFQLQILERVGERKELEAREQHYLDLFQPFYNESLFAVRAPYRTWRSDALDEARFWNKVCRVEEGCWLWNGTLLAQGYGCFKIAGRMYKAHRLSYQFTHGNIPEGLVICHHCDNPRCVRPDHLFAGTHKDNAVDRDKKRRGYFCRPESRMTKVSGDRHWKRLHPELVRGELNPRAVLTREQVEVIRSRYARKEASQSALAREYGVAQTTISALIRRENWQD